MKKTYAIKRTTSFIIIFSIIYSIFELNVAFLLPIITVLIPFRFMKEKKGSKEAYNKDKKTLTRLLLFNFISIELASILTQNMNDFTFNLSIGMLIYLIYFIILSQSEKKVSQVQKNPDILYNELKRRIDVLEDMRNKNIEAIENASDERMKRNMQVKLNKIDNKLNTTKKQLDMIESLMNNKQ